MAEITPTQLEQHNTTQDLWVAVHGNVYDLTSFATDHPGGIDVLVECAGTDATEPYDYAGHGDDAAKRMQKFKVGVLAEHRNNRTVGSSRDEQAGSNEAPVATGERADQTSSSWVAKAGSASGSRLAFPLLVGISALVGLGSQTTAVEAPRPWSSSLTSFVDSFIGGFLVTLTLVCAGLGYVYVRFTETLKHGQDVFDCPAVIPRRKP